MGILFGYRKTLAYLLGIASGFFVAMLACAFLSNVLLAVMPSAEACLRWVGAGYILWLALGTLRNTYQVAATPKNTAAYGKGFVLQLANPKVAVYGLTLYSTFLAAISGKVGLLVAFAAFFALTAFAAVSLWALCGAAIRNVLKRDSFRKALNLGLALLLVYTAVMLSGIMP